MKTNEDQVPHFQFDVRETGEHGHLSGNLMGPMGEFYVTILGANPNFITFMLKALNSQGNTDEQAATH